jgi:3-oxoacyl-[acyl-carrier protein] reductase
LAARGGGVIIHNASICAMQPLPSEPIYNVTKAALAMLSKAWRTGSSGPRSPRSIRVTLA